MPRRAIELIKAHTIIHLKRLRNYADCSNHVDIDNIIEYIRSEVKENPLHAVTNRSNVNPSQAGANTRVKDF